MDAEVPRELTSDVTFDNRKDQYGSLPKFGAGEAKPSKVGKMPQRQHINSRWGGPRGSYATTRLAAMLMACLMSAPLLIGDGPRCPYNCHLRWSLLALGIQVRPSGAGCTREP
jgi:hypothetical protein